MYVSVQVSAGVQVCACNVNECVCRCVQVCAGVCRYAFDLCIVQERQAIARVNECTGPDVAGWHHQAE